MIHAHYNTSLFKALCSVYPNYPWLLLKFVNNIFQRHDVLPRYKHPFMSFSGTKVQIELDIFLPTLSLAFEYQGRQHFQPVTFFVLGDLPKRDNEKRTLCEQAGISLV